MTLSRFDLDLTSKILNLSLLRFNEQSGFENLAKYMNFFSQHLKAQTKKIRNS